MYRVKSVNVRDEAMRPAHCPTPDRSFESRYLRPTCILRPWTQEADQNELDKIITDWMVGF